MPGSANLKNHFSKSVSSFAETSGREEKHKLTIQSPVVCPAPPHLGRIFVKTRKQISTSDINILCANYVVGDVWLVLALPRPMVRCTAIRAWRQLRDICINKYTDINGLCIS